MFNFWGILTVVLFLILGALDGANNFAQAATKKISFACTTTDHTTIAQFSAKVEAKIDDSNNVTGWISYSTREAGPNQTSTTETKIDIEGQADFHPAGTITNNDLISLAVHQEDDTSKGFLILFGTKGQLELSSQAILNGNQYKSTCE